MPGLRTDRRTGRNLRKKVLPHAAAALLAVVPTTLAASQPIWQPALYCAALDATRAGLGVNHAGDADLSSRVYLRIAAEALHCPPPAQLDAMLSTARIGVGHRLELAAQYGLDAGAMALALASESELVCALHFDPALLETARLAEAASPPAPPCGGHTD
ncbi:hypothetical protein N8I71_17145 [Roseibacterium sp. SDUM158016]|uniref:hypothetical protein n=1 Tax=Roseicyclus sediminis TaxID=2980997 RepID=UPI0021CEA87A|nr:hypothetical protein [Roseibacterium sp. SDUM158016]MCU4654568.1 hypothetical protein [Roseibacterium sp. SDUM158016]